MDCWYWRETRSREIKSLEADIESIRRQAGVRSASELHDKIDDYEIALGLEDLKRKAAQREKAGDEPEETQRRTPSRALLTVSGCLQN